ncbi:MAG: CHASE2 domain-containing protein [Spirochaetes bacterium]|jgi:adenylate cyclase|nr:CHASE2 domain-containing protein [Spirochaetota bacterium]
MIKQFLDSLKEKLEKSRLTAVAISLGAFVFLFALSFTRPYELFELKLYDLNFHAKPSISQWDRLTFLNIDDSAIYSVGQYPWPRHIYAAGLDVLGRVGARQAVFDIQFIEESPLLVDRKAMPGLEEKIKKGRPVKGDDITRALIDSDRIFADSAKAFGKAVLAYSFSKEKLVLYNLDEKAQAERKAAIQYFTNKASIPVPEKNAAAYSGLIDPDRVQIQYPVPQLVRAARTFGFVDSDFDIDGIARKIRLIRVFEGRIYFHMALAMIADLCGVPFKDIEVVPGQRIVLRNAENPITHTRGDIVIPIDGHGMIYINWADDFEKAFDHLSYYALMEYDDVRDEVHGYFDEEEIKSGNTDRSLLYGKLSQLYAKFESSKEEAVRRDTWKEIADARKKIYEIEKGYAGPLQEEIKRLKAELKKEKNADIEAEIQNLETFVTAINITLAVERLRDHSVIMGLTATATSDIGVTPLSSEYMMVGTYHNIVNTVLQRSFIKKADPIVSYALMLVIALVIGLTIQRLSAVRSVVATVASFVVVNAGIFAAFAFGRVWVDQVGISMALLLPALAIIATKFVSEESQKRFIKSAFSHYLSPHVIDEIIKNPESLNLGGEMREISIFFSDVAGFSTISEKLTPPQLVALLNEYLSEMTDIILSYDGTVDKYEGDAIIAFFGAPHPYPDHALKLCMAAIDMKKRLAEMRERWRSIGQQELKVRMGMNTGNAVVGNMGSRTRMDYTMMGDSVNLAARLEGANKYYSTYAMISENTYLQAKDHIEARELDLIKVVGKNEPIKVFELLGKKGNLPDYMMEMLRKYYEGLELFRARDWKGARTAFKGGLKVVEDDGPCKTYVERCTEFIDTPPPRNWDGVYKLKTK